MRFLFCLLTFTMHYGTIRAIRESEETENLYGHLIYNYIHDSRSIAELYL